MGSCRDVAPARYPSGSGKEQAISGGDSNPVIFVIDADPAVRDGIASLVRTLGAEPLCFDSAEACLEDVNGRAPVCLITEVALPGMDGIDLLDHLRSRGISTPTIFLATEGSVRAAVRAMRSGAVDYLEKPFVDRQLVSRIKEFCQLPQKS